MTEDQTIRGQCLPTQLVGKKIVDSTEVVLHIGCPRDDLTDTGLPVDGQDHVSIHLTDIPPLEGSGFPDPDSGVRQDQDIVHQHRPFPEGLLVGDLYELPEVTDNLPPFPFVEVGTTRLFTVDPWEFRDFLEVTLLHTPPEEMSKVVLDPFGGVG